MNQVFTGTSKGMHGRSPNGSGNGGLSSITRLLRSAINDEHRYVQQVQPVDRSAVDLRQLEYAVAVADELHFGRAAARMRVTQQSVSEQIRRLERELGAPLFSRTSRRVTVTAVGEEFLPEARRALAAARHALEVGRLAAQGHAGELRFGYAEDLGSRLIQLAVPRLRRRAPSIRVQPQPMTTPDQLVALTERRLDLGLGWAPELTGDLTALLVSREPLVLALAADHPLAAAPAVDPVELSHLPLLVVPREVNPSLHDRVTSQLAALGVTVTVHQHVSNLDRMLPLVLAGSAIGITVPSAAAANPTGGIVYRPFADPSPHVDVSLVWRRDSTDPSVPLLVDVVRELRDTGAFLPPDPAG
jgi:DNA-binding transcriptional LysR family regulator